MRVAFAQSQLRQFRRDVREGASTAGNTVELIRAFEDFKDLIAPFQNLITNVLTKVLTTLVQGFNNVIRFFNSLGFGEIIAYLSDIAGNTKPKSDPNRVLFPGEQLINDLAKGKFKERQQPLFKLNEAN